MSAGRAGELGQSADRVRAHILRRANAAGNNGAHIAPSLCEAEILTVLFQEVLYKNEEDRTDPARDRFILSKGHGALGYYAAMYEAGMITEGEFFSFEVNGGNFPGQPSKHPEHRIEYSSGSLGLGLSYGIGLARSEACRRHPFRVFVYMGDGELNEGTIWESAMYAGFHKLSNIVGIVDHNSMQSDGASSDILLFDIAGMWKACGWAVVPCDGHDPEQLLSAFSAAHEDRPLLILAETVKGRGVPFMENAAEWHHSRLTDAQLEEALAAIERDRQYNHGNQ
ncbi:MAG: transketolase [Clostridiales Family XIII bacterium]|jgi:transketolase|nr:transketolase [Clostridiales Family XIII bacterium]